MYWIILDLFIWSGDGITEKVQTDLKPCYSHSHSLLIAIHMPSCSLVRQQETFQAQMQMNFPSCMATHFAIAWFIELHKNWLFGCEKLHIQCDEKNMFLNNPVVLPHWSQFPAAAPNGSKDPTHHRVTCHRASAKNMGLPFARRMWVYPNTKKDRKVHHHHLHHHHHQHLIIIDHYQPLLTIMNHHHHHHHHHHHQQQQQHQIIEDVLCHLVGDENLSSMHCDENRECCAYQNRRLDPCGSVNRHPDLRWLEVKWSLKIAIHQQLSSSSWKTPTCRTRLLLLEILRKASGASKPLNSPVSDWIMNPSNCRCLLHKLK